MAGRAPAEAQAKERAALGSTARVYGVSAVCGSRKVRILRQRLTRVESGTIQVGNESADDEKALEVLCVHLAASLPGDGFVIDGHSVPGRIGFLLLLDVHAAQAAVIVVPESSEVIECCHFKVGASQDPRQLFADGVECTGHGIVFQCPPRAIPTRLRPFPFASADSGFRECALDIFRRGTHVGWFPLPGHPSPGRPSSEGTPLFWRCAGIALRKERPAAVSILPGFAVDALDKGVESDAGGKQ